MMQWARRHRGFSMEGAGRSIPHSTEPVSRRFGYDRGTPIDRLYIERFLAESSQDIQGRVLELGDSTYSRRFGSHVTRQDVLHVNDTEKATIVGDLAQSTTLPDSAFDCIVLIQTLHLIYDLGPAIQNIRRALLPGGVALVTVPGVSSVDRGEWGASWYWSLTELAAKRLFAEVFGSDNVEVATFGNLYAASCFLQGLAVEEADPSLLSVSDATYPVIVTVRAVRR
jgi:SAM-dependent methyltransferase